MLNIKRYSLQDEADKAVKEAENHKVSEDENLPELLEEGRRLII